MIFKYVVDEKDCNLMGTLHGGAIATLADNLTTYPILIEDRNGRAGVSASLMVDYCSAPKPGETVFIECKADKVGKNLGFSTAIFRNEKVCDQWPYFKQPIDADS
jgi:acyl-coenzyme A thioesterase 13